MLKSFGTNATKLALVWLILGLACNAQSARDYYNELYKAGGLDRMADEYVCFDDSQDLQTFFIVGNSDTVKWFLQHEGEFAKPPKSQQAELNRGFLIVHQYAKGIDNGRMFYAKDDNSWVTDQFTVGSQKKMPMRMRLSITWETLRYQHRVELLNAGDLSFTGQAVSHYGRCERIPSDVKQK